MKALKISPVLQHKPDTIEKVRKAFDLNTPGRMDESIDILEEWIKKEPHFIKKDFERDFLEGFIIRGKGSVEKAKRYIERICTLKTIHSDLFEPIRPNTVPDLETVSEAILPRQTADYCSIYLVKVTNQNFGDDYFYNYYKRSFALYDYICRYDYSLGFVAILDYRGCNMARLVTVLTNTNLRLSIDIVFKSIGLRLTSLHILSDSLLVEALAALSKPLLGEKVNKLHLHRTNESLHEHIEKDLLPEDYGGKELPLDVLAKNMLDFLSSDEMFNNMVESSKDKIDMSIKPVSETYDSEMGVPGSFRSLAVD